MSRAPGRARRRTASSNTEFGERPPRLVLRFAVLTALCLGAATAGILVFTRHLNQSAAQREAARHATFVAKTMLTKSISSADVSGPVSGARRAQLDRRLQHLLGSFGTDATGVNGIIPALAISVSGGDGRITYSTDHSLIGKATVPPARLRDARDGYTSSEISKSTNGETSDGLSHKTLEAYVPFALHDYGRGVAVMSLDYRAIGAAASSAFYPIAGILELVLVVLYVLLVPLLMQVSRRLRRQVDRIQHQAYHDELTGLANRLYYRERATTLIGQLSADESLAVLIVDLDRFKEINDTLGHQAGDALLFQLAGRLRDELGPEVMLARLGGDEFGLIAAPANRAEALDLGGRINAAMRESFVIGGVPVGVEASVGIAVSPDHGGDVDALMARADIAMYQAKARHSGAVVYEEAFDESKQIQVGLLGELRRALDEHEIVLRYQPKVDLTTSEIVGVETLVRWQHPERGLITPDAFLPYAEKTGVNRSLTRYVLEAALEQSRKWEKQGLDLTVAVNLTMFDLLDPGLAEEVAALLVQWGVEARHLELEITESEIMSDVGQVRTTLERLREQGVRIAIDDFGSGYSSLAYLKTLPVDTLKIDKSFVLGMSDDPRDAAIVRTAIALAHTLDLEVVAEGVETAAIRDKLREARCNVGQGFHFGRPERAEQVSQRIRRRRAAAAKQGRKRAA
jgi:diguanylate cyclase (GGDEF)-like protein